MITDSDIISESKSSPEESRTTASRSTSNVDDSENKVVWGSSDPENPRNWSLRYKLFTGFMLLLTLNVAIASSAPASATTAIQTDFRISDEVSFMPIAVFLLGYAFGPVLWGPGSECYGRRIVFITTLSGYTILFLGQALAPNIETLLFSRFFSGFFAVAPLNNSSGVIADIWSVVDRSAATSIFTAAAFLGPVVGPLLSGYIVTAGLSWRWVFWILMTFSGWCTLLIIIFMPETYPPVLLMRKAKKIREEDPTSLAYAEHERLDWTLSGIIHRTIFRPFQMLFTEIILALVTVYISLIYGVIFLLFEAFPIIYMDRRHFDIKQNSLMYVWVGVGTTLGAICNYLFDRRYPKLAREWKGFPPPEQRLYGAMVGGICMVVATLWLGWTGEFSSIPWYIPGMSTLLLGFGMNLIFMSFGNYLIDTYQDYSASAFSVTVIVRSIVATAFPLFTNPMFRKLGINGGCMVIACFSLFLAFSPFLFFFYGDRIRKISNFAPCEDLKIKMERERIEEELATMDKEKPDEGKTKNMIDESSQKAA